MKRTAMLLMLMLLPMCLVSMNPISDSDLSEVTGQAGVTIHIDASMDVSFAEIGWGDVDGVPAISTEGGWIGIDSLKMDRLHVWPRTDFAMESSDFIGTYNKNGDGGVSDLQFTTMDLVNLPVGRVHSNNGPLYSQTGTDEFYVVQRTGIPTLTITMDSMLANIVLGPMDRDPVTDRYKPGFNQTMGQLYMSGLNVATGKDGVAMISSHVNGSTADSIFSNLLVGSGITMEMQNVKIDYLLLDKLAWGDIDGVEDICRSDSALASQDVARETRGLNGKGWVGLRDLAIKNINIDGQNFIDVGATHASDDSVVDNIHVVGGAAYLDLPEVMNEIYNAAFRRNGGKSLSSIMLGNGFTITMEELGSGIVLGRSTSDDDFAKKMGDIYISGMRIGMYSNRETQARSYVRIFAH